MLCQSVKEAKCTFRKMLRKYSENYLALKGHELGKTAD
jgi:hypothetical protein